MADSPEKEVFMTGEELHYEELRELAAAGLLLPPPPRYPRKPDDVIDGLRERIYDAAVSQYGSALAFQAIGPDGYIEIVPGHQANIETEALAEAA